ncbi:hypothetical protein KJ567_00285 [Candidatus Bipolaricaulota bacterium]|nr:hypothetical protein [Candidatus Bipolaricaulota bacterium]
MMKTARLLMAMLVIGLGVGAALMLGGCDGDDLAQAASTTASGQAAGSADIEAAAAQVAQPTPAESTAVAATAPEASATTVMDIDTLIESAAAYDGKEVLLQGKILTQCIRGCQFTLDDGTGVVGVELVDEALENVLMTGSVGRTVLVRGIVETSPRPLVVIESRDGWSYID